MNSEGTNKWVKCISTQGNIRGVALQATDLVRAMAERHQVTGIAAQGLGEAAMGALLLASYCKPGERMNLNIQGSGHYRQALVDAYPDGTVRGYVVERDMSQPELDHSAQEGLGPWGKGLLSVLRTKHGDDQRVRQPYIGTVPLVTGHLAKDLTFYWAQSEQIPSAVGLAVKMQSGKINSAGGFLIQALPGASASEIKAIEQQIQNIGSLAEEFVEHPNPLHLLSTIMGGTSFLIVEEKELQFKCNCSWERVERALALVGPAELKAMIKEEDPALVRCDFCAKEYPVDVPTLERLIKAAQG